MGIPLLCFRALVALLVAQTHAFPRLMVPQQPIYLQALSEYAVADSLLEKFQAIQPADILNPQLQQLVALAVVQETAVTLSKDLTQNITTIYLDNVAKLPVQAYENPQRFGRAIKRFRKAVKIETAEPKEKVEQVCVETQRDCDTVLDNLAQNNPALRKSLDQVLALGHLSRTFIDILPSIVYAAHAYKVEELLLNDSQQFLYLAEFLALKLKQMTDDDLYD